jgi:hypothetical protein
VRRGASWTAAYHRQLTVAPVAGPARGSVGALGVLGAERSWLLAQTASAGGASSRSRAVGRRRRGRPCQQARHGVGRRCPAGGVHPSGIGVRDPAVQPSGVRSPGVVVQRVRRPAVRCPPIQRPAVWCPAVWCPAVWCPAVRRTRSYPSTSGGGRATVTTGTGGGSCGCRAVDGSIDGPGGRDAGDAAQVAVVSRWSVADRVTGLGRAAAAAPAR